MLELGAPPSLWSIITTFAQLVLGGGVLVAIIRTRPTLKKIANEREANLLVERADEMETMRGRIAALEAKLEEKDTIHEAERAVDRHRINNLQTCFDALLLLIESNPERAKEAAAKMKALRADQMQAEATEKAAVSAAKIARKGAGK